MTKLWLDLETYSEVPITNGTHAYAADAEVMLFAWALDDGPVSVWEVEHDHCPAELSAALCDESVELWAHNSFFDRTVLSYAFGGYKLALPRWRDTMVQAYTHGLPGALGALCEVLKVPTDKAKDKDGRRLIQLFCMPRPFKHALKRETGERMAQFKRRIEQARANWQGRATRKTHPADWAKFVEYAGLDIEAMRECHKRMPVWNYSGRELDLWHLDQHMNDRGVAIDVPLVHAAIKTVERAQADLAAQTMAATGDALESTTKRDKFLEYVLQEYGVDLPDLQGATIERRVNDPDLPVELRELLAIRLQASTSSTAKYKTLAKATSVDGRLRGVLQFAGAGRTRRWAGRLFQPQNLPRPVLDNEDIELGIEAMLHDSAHLLYDNVMELCSSAIRGTIIAPKGRKLVVADLSNIEGRDQAWLADERWKLDAFRSFDNGTGFDLYKLAYAKSFGVKPEAVTKDQRQVGKVQELALGYEGGVGAFVTFAAAYGIDLDDLAAKVLPVAPGWAVDEAVGFYEWTVKQKRSTFGLSRDAFVACDAVKRGWRDVHFAISGYWGELKNTVTDAISNPGTTLTCRKLKVRRDGNWLRIGLPSGSVMCYPSPALDESGTITYMGMNQYTRKWSRLKTYGGKLFENICQSVARDVMAHNMPLIEASGYEILLTVHDEVICEAPDSPEFNADHLASLLAANPPWAPDMPLAAAGFETYRYKKD